MKVEESESVCKNRSNEEISAQWKTGVMLMCLKINIEHL
jgi:hypothetical protein